VKPVSGDVRARTVAWILAAAACACSTEPAAPVPAGGSGARPRSCNNVEYEAVRLDFENKHPEALERYAEAVGRCEDVPLIRDRVLLAIADLARRSPEHCSLALELHGRAAASTGTAFLRSCVYLSRACGSRELETDLDRLAASASRDVYGEAAAEMTAFVREHERMQLDKWAWDESAHVRSLRAATRELCADDRRIDRVLDSMNRIGIGRDNGLSLVGLWTVQPAEALDPDSRACLTRLASRIEDRIDGFEPRVKRDLTIVLHWVRSDFRELPAGDGT